MSFVKSFLASLALLLCCGSCGYRSASSQDVLSSYSTITVPYVEGDLEGDFTQQLIATVAESTPLNYRTLEAELTLAVKILDTKHEDVGYNRFFNQNRQIERWMVPNERLLSRLVEVSLIDEASQKIILGPEKIFASVKYDFNPEISETNLVRFSLGQYDFVENAQRTANTPLNKRLSQKISAYLVNSW